MAWKKKRERILHLSIKAKIGERIQETGVSSKKLEENVKVELQITKSREPLRNAVRNRNQDRYSLLIPDLWLPLSF
jgi:hypothetical protein